MSGGTTPNASGVTAVVVTYRRQELLRECLAALAAQTVPPGRVLVVDNASGDGTPDMVRREFPGVEVLELPHNSGAAGGFSAGIAHALAHDPEWLWVLDDDTIPDASCLEALLTAAARSAGAGATVLASRVRAPDGRLHPFNIPRLRRPSVEEHLAAVADGLVPIRYASFVSVMARASAVRRHGGPRLGFHIWNDDVDWTARMLRDEAGYLVPASTVLHKNVPRQSSHGPRFYYEVRNKLFLLRGDAFGPTEWRERGKLVYYLVRGIAGYLTENRLGREALTTVARGLRDGARMPVPA